MNKICVQNTKKKELGNLTKEQITVSFCHIAFC